MQTSVSANKSQEIQLGGGETESGFIPKLHRSSWEENLAWNSHSICNLATVPRLGHLGVDGRMFSLTCSWLRISLLSVLLQLKCVNSVGSREDSVTWSGGEWENGRNHLFAAELSLFISNFLANLCGESLSLASVPGRRRIWAVISSALVCYYRFPTNRCAGRSSALTLGHVCHCIIYLRVGKCILEGFWDVPTGWQWWIFVLCPGSKLASLMQSASTSAGTPTQAVTQL